MMLLLLMILNANSRVSKWQNGRVPIPTSRFDSHYSQFIRRFLVNIRVWGDNSNLRHCWEVFENPTTGWAKHREWVKGWNCSNAVDGYSRTKLQVILNVRSLFKYWTRQNMFSLPNSYSQQRWSKSRRSSLCYLKKDNRD